MATQIAYRLLTAEEFLAIDFGPDSKAELDNGVIHMMAGGTRRHAGVSGNIFAALHTRLRGTGCAPYGSDMAARTHDRSVRYPDVSVYCGRDDPAFDNDKSDPDPAVVFEVLSAGTARTDLRVKLDEYKVLPSVQTIIFVDIAVERLRVVQRTGPSGWFDDTHTEPYDLVLPSLNLTIPHAEIFARD